MLPTLLLDKMKRDFKVHGGKTYAVLKSLHLLKNNPRKLAEAIQELQQYGLMFHGSDQFLTDLQPAWSRLTSKPVVFGGLPWAALCFTRNWTDKDFAQGTINDQPYFHSLRKGGFGIYNPGGWLHLVSPESFRWQENLTRYEFVSEEHVPVISGFFIKEVIETLQYMGVDVSEHVGDKPALSSPLTEW